MYRTIEDFLKDWNYESEATLKVMKAVSDESLGQKVTPEGRSLGFLAWHVVLTLGEMGGLAGLQVDAPPQDAPVPDSAGKILAAYDSAAHSLARQVKRHWDNAMLGQEIDMYGEKWTRGQTLSSLVRHQAHHRAQMTVLMRQAGLAVPGVYGPSREEWTLFGRPPMD